MYKEILISTPIQFLEYWWTWCFYICPALRTYSHSLPAQISLLGFCCSPCSPISWGWTHRFEGAGGIALCTNIHVQPPHNFSPSPPSADQLQPFANPLCSHGSGSGMASEETWANSFKSGMDDFPVPFSWAMIYNTLLAAPYSQIIRSCCGLFFPRAQLLVLALEFIHRQSFPMDFRDRPQHGNMFVFHRSALNTEPFRGSFPEVPLACREGLKGKDHQLTKTELGQRQVYDAAYTGSVCWMFCMERCGQKKDRSPEFLPSHI